MTSRYNQVLIFLCAITFLFAKCHATLSRIFDQVQVDLSETSPFSHYWKRSFGSGHATLTLRDDWRRQLKQAVADLGLQGIRHHGILDDDMNVVTAPGKYNFTLVEKSWLFQVQHNVTPIVELSFMPAILANCTWISPLDGRVVNPDHDPCKPGMQYKNIPMPPTSYNDWYALVKALVSHAVKTFGIEEVETWHFECWNELWGMPFPETYMKLYNASSRAVKAVSPRLKVGGPATAQLLDLEDFVEAATKINAPFDFISTHMYPTDPMCPTKASWGPDCLSSHVKAAKKLIEDANVPLYLTEYNVGCCIGYQLHDGPGAAAFAFRTVGALDGITDVLSWWTFSDIFEEETSVEKHTEYMNVYGLMTVSGIPKPGWRAFQLLHQYAGQTRVKATVTESTIHSSESLDYEQLNCSVEPNTDMSGFDIGRAKSSKTIGECCDACRSNISCSFWTFFNSNSSCYLKSSDAGRRRTTGSISGSSTPPPKPSGKGTRISALVTSKALGNSTARLQLRGISVFLSYWSVNRTQDIDRRVRINFIRDNINIPYWNRQSITGYRIDELHSNAYPEWQKMGSPGKPSAEQVRHLIKASELEKSPVPVSADGSVVVTMSPNSAMLLLF